ncbi:MAG TPA: bifunctional UDP-3-O-[3-hydroxymyristoyl] N-acetylglucosamine deacetylase/3-hydroxyacyl-ACP dehydratase [Longimicrobiales bacterium]|nr:bifunctional UDP-3-O-[3-hydroxymyristoyl] N-acetylglucosamine deacetylase/3-hydroxyacyl-ACP dehydratase [Longimicrobiales bacterium]
MSGPKQQTLAGTAELEGAGIHTGKPAHLRFVPAEAGAGIRFIRTDLDGKPEIPATLAHVRDTDLGTTLAAGEAEAKTVEHVLAAVGALRIDNVTIEISGPEVPIMDGSFLPFMEALERVGVEEQAERAEVLRIAGPVTVDGPRGGHYVCAPAEDLRISATIEFDHPLVRRQFASFNVDETFGDEIGPARTFGFLRDAEALHARGLALGASTDNAVILDEDGVIEGELRFADEFVRHKIGDLVGDLTVLGGRVVGHIVAERPSHAGNLELGRAILEAHRRGGDGVVDITKIMQYLPHRYPMLLVDRIVDFEAGKRIVGIKNVTINEPFFQGHYPGHPVMPGVLIIEAMAQVGGLLMMDVIENAEDKVVYFMTLDNVKWRRPVTPGDQIVFELEMVQFKRHTCRMKGIGYVDGKVVAEAEMMARIVDR